MPDPTWPSSPPEANYLRLVGPGAAGTSTTMASGAVWQALTISGELALSASVINTSRTAVDFEGVGGVSSTGAIAGLNSALQLLAGWAQEKPPIAGSAVAAYETAVSTMIPAEVSLANRAEQSANVAINPLVFGALTPAIVALDTEYFGEHWPHNASAGIAYGAALTALTAALAIPPPLSPAGASPAASATAAAAVAQAAGQTAASEAVEQTAQLTKSLGDGAAVPTEVAGQAGQLASLMAQPAQAMMQPILGMFGVPMQAVGGMAGLPQSLGGTLGSHVFGDEQIPAPLLTPTGLPAVGAGGAGAVGSFAGGGAGSFSGGAPGTGLTSYTRPASTFASENSGRPAALKTGLLSAAEFRGPTTTGLGGAFPVLPAHAGTPAPGKAADDRGGVPHARVIVGPERRRDNRTG
jgi:hypothetical protein